MTEGHADFSSWPNVTSRGACAAVVSGAKRKADVQYTDEDWAAWLGW